MMLLSIVHWRNGMIIENCRNIIFIIIPFVAQSKIILQRLSTRFSSQAYLINKLVLPTYPSPTATHFTKLLSVIFKNKTHNFILKYSHMFYLEYSLFLLSVYDHFFILPPILPDISKLNTNSISIHLILSTGIVIALFKKQKLYNLHTFA